MDEYVQYYRLAGPPKEFAVGSLVYFLLSYLALMISKGHIDGFLYCVLISLTYTMRLLNRCISIINQKQNVTINVLEDFDEAWSKKF